MTKILVVGQTPPPYGGQALSIQLMLDGKYKNVQFHHVRMAFSREMDDIGKFDFTKIWHLFVVIFSIIYSRLRHQTPILYYVPAGPNRIPMYRDFAILIFTRWLFKKTIFQFRAAGISEIYDRLTLSERFLFRIAYFNVDLAIRLSKFTPDDGKFIQARKNIIVPNGLEDYYTKFGMPLKEKKNQLVLLFVGIIHESKGIMVLLDACRLLKESGVIFKMKLMGKFESISFRHRVDEFINIKELSNYVEFLGVQTANKKWETYKDADILVFPSYFESEAMPRTVLEAMSFQIPIVATKWRGILSLVEEGKSGYLVPIKDSVALAEKINVLFKDASLRESMGKRGREIYLERFTAETFWRNMEEAFLSIA